MSLTVARSIAYSALTATQVQMSVTSANVANAGTDGYTRKLAQQTSTVTAGVGTGTAVTGVAGTVDRYLLKSLVAATSELGGAKTTADYADRLQSLFGSTSGEGGTGTSIANTIATLEAALASLAQTPESDSLKAQAVSELDALATQLREASAGIQALRADADATVASAVDDANGYLHAIDELNDQIARTAARGDPTADFEDKRNSALVSLSSLMDVSSFVNANGSLQVYTSSGQVLVDSGVHELQYNSAVAVTAATSYMAGGSGGFDAIRVDGKDITAQVTSGTIAAAVAQRDEVLPAAQAELDVLAVTLADTLNAIHNQGTALPPPSNLTGSTTVAAGDSLSASGIVRLAVADEDGNLLSYQDLDLSSYATVGDLVAAIDGIGGLAATIDADGHVVVSAEDAGQGVAINQMTSAVGAQNQGLSAWLGLNNLVSATGAFDFRIRGDILAEPSRIATSMLDGGNAPSVGDPVITVGSTTIGDALVRAFTDTTAFSAAGSLSASTTTFASYAAGIVSEAASAAERAARAHDSKETTQATLSDRIASQSGVNLDEETARLSELETLYSAAAQIVATLNTMFEALLAAARTA